MSLIALGSVKSSPGVTTTALALASAWPAGPRVVVVECDPAGGDLCASFGLTESPGLVSLAAAARHSREAELLWRHTKTLPGGLAVVPGPVGAERARAALGVITADRPSVVACAGEQPDVVVIADCGRLDPESAASGVAQEADLVLLVARPRMSELAHLAARVDRLRRLFGPSDGKLGLLLTGDGAFASGEVADALGIPVAGVLPADRRAAKALSGQVIFTRGLSRLPLLRAAHTLARRLSRTPTGDDQAASHEQPGRAAAAPDSPRAADAVRASSSPHPGPPREVTR